jgi:hypothetical protein
VSVQLVQSALSEQNAELAIVVNVIADAIVIVVIHVVITASHTAVAELSLQMVNS